jgi:glyoxylase-like metal-dependent hydrolase (beta-lactamase superfamily II)
MNFAELKYVDGSERCPSTPTGVAGALFLKTPFPHLQFESFRPDLNADREFDLSPYGVEATVLPTGGHTPGHLAVYVPSTGELLAIDLIAGGIVIGGVMFNGRPVWPTLSRKQSGGFHVTKKASETAGSAEDSCVSWWTVAARGGQSMAPQVGQI